MTRREDWQRPRGPSRRTDAAALTPTVVALRALAIYVLAVLAVCVAPRLAPAHPLAPALLDLTEQQEGRVEVRWKRSLLRGPGDRVEPVLPSHCTSLGPGTRTRGSNYELIRWVVDCGERGLVGSTIDVRGLTDARINALIHVTLVDGRTMSRVLSGGDEAFVVPARVRRLAVFRDYTRYGFNHILSGMDHLLFVFGLLLLARGVRALLLTITCFTIGHSMSLALAVLDFVRLPQSFCNVVVALTILVLAIELARDPEESKDTLLRRYPWSMTLCFGFLHGLGFAGALRQVGLPQEEIPLALFSFNLGIELGQLSFVTAVFVFFWKPLAELTQRVLWGRLVPVYIMGSLAAYWCIQRVAVLITS